jgi:hypothetical protein
MDEENPFRDDSRFSHGCGVRTYTGRDLHMRITGWLAALALMVGSPALLLAQRVAAPTGVSVACTNAQFTVSWNNMANVGLYTVNQREGTTVRTMASQPASPYTTSPCPTPGTAYEYQVVSIGKGAKNTAASAWVAYTVPIPVPTTTGTVIPLDPTAPRTPPTVVPVGPTSLTAGSTIPGQINLGWREVANATGYRVTRSSDAPQSEAQIAQYASTDQLAEGGFWYHKDAPVDERWTFTYKVYALFGTTVSTPSPPASAKSIAVIQPTGLKYGVTILPGAAPGMVTVTLSWTGVPNVDRYIITGIAFTGGAFAYTKSTSYTLNNVPASHTYPVCVGAIYPFDVQNQSTAPCIDVKLQ